MGCGALFQNDKGSIGRCLIESNYDPVASAVIGPSWNALLPLVTSLNAIRGWQILETN